MFTPFSRYSEMSVSDDIIRLELKLRLLSRVACMYWYCVDAHVGL